MQIFIDYNKDGFPDLFIASYSNDGSAPLDALYKNNGDGTFSNVTAEVGLSAGAESLGAVWGDIDNDGDLDLILGREAASPYIF